VSWPGRRWAPSDLGTDGSLFSYRAGSGGRETLERMMASQRRRYRGVGDGDDGPTGFTAGAPSPLAASMTASEPVQHTVSETGPAWIHIDNTNAPAAVYVNSHGPIWVTVHDDIGALQLYVEAGDLLTIETGGTATITEGN